MIDGFQPTLGGKLRRELSRFASRRPATASLARPLASFSFDDVPLTAALAGAAVLEARGLRGTFYVCGGLAGASGAMGALADHEHIRALAARGHEIACHTYSHPDCGRLVAPAVDAELDRNAAALASWGLPAPATFAYPFGEVSPAAKSRAADRFALARSVRRGLVRGGSDLAQAPAVGLVGPQADRTARAWIEKARRADGWIIFYTHDVRDEPSAWGATPGALAASVDAAIAAGLEVVTVAEGARRMRAAA
ncbi:MAG TPA: polysaccharide deacetylase family protein [Caulobacteraceae bacterium]|jgi:peptidoglycan/xylan/chitin deacetylase (PgdA/CDA1 family)